MSRNCHVNFCHFCQVSRGVGSGSVGPFHKIILGIRRFPQDVFSGTRFALYKISIFYRQGWWRSSQARLFFRRQVVPGKVPQRRIAWWGTASGGEDLTKWLSVRLLGSIKTLNHGESRHANTLDIQTTTKKALCAAAWRCCTGPDVQQHLGSLFWLYKTQCLR